MSTAELELLRARALKGGSEERLELLRFIRKKKLREPRMVLEFGPKEEEKLAKVDSWGGILKILFAAISGEEERWKLCEQVVVAALDLGDLDMVNIRLGKLKSRFPGSLHVKCLYACREEGEGRTEDALKLYDEILEEAPANALVMKHRVAVFMSLGQIASATKALSDYLEVHNNDKEAWIQLATLYMSASQYQKAAFCFEELVLLSPSDPYKHCRLAEAYYTLGKADGLMRARKHFSKSLELSKGYPRALYGLSASCASLATSSDRDCQKKLQSEGVEVNEALHAFAVSELAILYQDSNPKLADASASVMAKRSAQLQH
eukprot:17560_1